MLGIVPLSGGRFSDWRHNICSLPDLRSSCLRRMMDSRFEEVRGAHARRVKINRATGKANEWLLTQPNREAI